ncbi:hypothetical protein DFO67_1146 [Modicisalibacter xianhensis]|uniref:Uncharacterized protein n=1 Tax=Modicisalibacter xianhensis TaxID=442341 RepID=A0A4R8FL31_9GAMM|nr:hypothetical protein DFO67_1146 [Halomonas xianhensis]
MYRCPNCNNFGVYPVKRRWWQRLLNLPHRYYCYDCGRECARSMVQRTRDESAASSQEESAADEERMETVQESCSR